MMRKWLIVLMTFFIIAAYGNVTAGIYASNDDLYKNLDQVATESSNDYFANYRDNYQLDMQKASFFKAPGSVIFNMFANFVFNLQIALAIMTITLFSFSLTTNISIMVGSFIEPFFIAMKISLWDDLAIYAIGIGAFLLLLKMAQNRTAQAVSSLISMIVIISVAFAFYMYPIHMLKGIDKVSTEIANAVMEGPYKAAVGGKAQDAKSKANEISWNLFVHMPWQVLEFGSIRTAEKYQDEILKLEPDSDERQDYVNKKAKSEHLFSKAMGFQSKRLVYALILLIFNMMLMAMLIIVSALIIGYQFLLLFYVLLGIFIFIVALIPSFGMYIIQRWGMRILSISATKILIVFFLSVILVLMSVLYKFADEYGLLSTMFLIVIMVVVLWFERFRLLELFAGYRSEGSQLNDAVHKPLDVDFNAINALRKMRNNNSNENGGGAGLPGQMGAGLDSSGQIDGRSGPYGQNSGSSGSYGGRTAGNGSGFTLSDSDSFSKASDSIHSMSKEVSQSFQSVREYYERAEEILQRQYDISKQNAENTIKDSNKEIQYDGFVKRTDKIRANGGSFDSRDLTNVANILRRADESGGDMNDVVTDGKSIYWDKQKSVNRPQSLQNVAQNISAYDSDFNGISQMKTPAPRVKGIEYFRNNFGDEQGEEIFNSLQERYGKEKLKDYRPFYNNNGSQSYAQVIKQLNDNIKTGKPQNNQSKPGDKSDHKTPGIQPIRLREGDGRNESKE